jgi:hypothetical protein
MWREASTRRIAESQVGSRLLLPLLLSWNKGRSSRVGVDCNPLDFEAVMRALAIFALLLTSNISLAFAQGHMGTPEEQRACSRDAQRFCRQQLNNDFAVQQCLQQNRTRLSKPCQKVFESHGM